MKERKNDGGKRYKNVGDEMNQRGDCSNAFEKMEWELQ